MSNQFREMEVEVRNHFGPTRLAKKDQVVCFFFVLYGSINWYQLFWKYSCDYVNLPRKIVGKKYFWGAK